MATREIFWNISSSDEIFLYVLAFFVVALFVYGVYLHVRRILKGRPVPLDRSGMARRIAGAVATIATNRTVVRRHPLAGVMHLGIFWGMVLLFIGTVIVAVEYDILHKIIGMDHAILQGSFYLWFELVLDIAGLLLVVGLVIGLIRRYALKRPQLKWQAVDLLLPVWLLLIAVTGFAVEGLRIAAVGAELGYSPSWSPVGMVAAGMIGPAGTGAATTLHGIVWWLHGILALAGIAILPFVPKVMHLLTAGVNILFQDLRPQGRLETLDVEGAFERDESLGYDVIADLNRKDLLDVASCTECGRCEMNCPAAISGKVLSPREIILGLRVQVNAENPAFAAPLEGQRILESSDSRISAEAIQVCTTCMACVESCPALIDPLSKILEIRRNEVMIQDAFPETYADVFNGMEKRGNPWNEHPTARLEWARGLDVPVMADAAEEGKAVEYLFWVGCSAAFDPRNQKIARAMVKILQTAGIKFAVLGEEERCTGDPARRMGHEYLFAMQAESNVELLNEYKFGKILTLCPHCFNTFKKEYPDFGGNYEVVHHTELIRDLVAQGRITLSERVEATVAFHDSCYLGRHNRIFEAPREVLAKIDGLKTAEMDRTREMAMCCGGGGGLTWYEEETDQRVNDRRLASAEAAVNGHGQGDDGRKFVATACPFCMTMLEDGLAARETDLQDRDIAELTAQAMGLKP